MQRLTFRIIIGFVLKNKSGGLLLEKIKIKSHKYPHRPHIEVEGTLLKETEQYFLVMCDESATLKHFIRNTELPFQYKTLHFLSKYYGYSVFITLNNAYEPIKIFCNISSPCERNKNGDIAYLDLDLDYVKTSHNEWVLRNNDMFLENSAKFNYPFQLANFTLVSLQELKNNIADNKFPFNVTDFSKYIM